MPFHFISLNVLDESYTMAGVRVGTRVLKLRLLIVVLA